MFKTKLRISGLALVVILFCSSSVYSQFPDEIFILESEDNITSPEGFPNQIGIGPSESLLFSVSNPSNLSVDTLNLVLNGFSLNSDVVRLVGINGLGIFDGVSSADLSETVSPFGDSTVTGSLSIASSAVAEGNIAEFILDTTGVPSAVQSSPDSVFDGVFEVSFGLNSNTGATTFLNDGAVVPTTNFLTLSFNVAVPEPSSAGVLLALGSIVMMRRKRA